MKAFLTKNKLEAPPLGDVIGILREFWRETIVISQMGTDLVFQFRFGGFYGNRSKLV